MATPTYTALATTTLSGSASSVTFSSIDQSYGDLVLVIDGTLTGGSALLMYLNGDTGANYSRVQMEGNGSSASSASSATAIIGVMGTQKLIGITQVMDYSATDKHKTALSRFNKSDRVQANAYRWANTSAVTSIELTPSNPDDFTSGTTFSLYGIAK